MVARTTKKLQNSVLVKSPRETQSITHWPSNRLDEDHSINGQQQDVRVISQIDIEISRKRDDWSTDPIRSMVFAYTLSFIMK